MWKMTRSMNFEKLISVSGIPGIHKMVANRNNGLIIEDMDSGKKRFASSRKHQFTPLESVAIYTDDGDSIELTSVFKNMLDQFQDNPPVDVKSSSQQLHEYFADVLPQYDRNRVMTSDIKRVIKWFTFLKERNYLDNKAKTTSSDEEE